MTDEPFKIPGQVPHPAFPLPKSKEELGRLVRAKGAPAVEAWLEQRAKLVKLAATDGTGDPLRHGVETFTGEDEDGNAVTFLPGYQAVRELIAGTYTDAKGRKHKARDILLLGSNRGGKSNVATKLVVEKWLNTPAAMCWVWTVNGDFSIHQQQKRIYNYLPPEVRAVKKIGQHTKISFTDHDGFSGNVAVWNGQVMLFKTYAGWFQDANVSEGESTHLNWMDEMAPAELADRLRIRNTDKSGLLLFTFTPKDGYTEAVAQYLDGAECLASQRTRYWRPDLPRLLNLPAGEVPFVLKSSAKEGRYVVVMLAEHNPFANHKELQEIHAKAPVADYLQVVLGWPCKQAGARFAKFGDVHIVKPEDVPKEGTNYCLVDPAGRNWFIQWYRVVNDGVRPKVYLYREWPDARTMGAWAEPGKNPDGKMGPAQTMGQGRGTREYREIMLAAEGWAPDEHGVWQRGEGAEEIFLRLIDKRGGTTAQTGHGKAMSVQELLAQDDVGDEGRVVVPGLDFVEALGGTARAEIENDIQLVNDWLDWNESAPLSELNRPVFYVSEACANSIYCFRTWTGQDGDKGASKDACDLLRYAARWPLEMIAAKAIECTGGGGGY